MRPSLVSLARRRRRPLLWLAGLFTAFSLAGFLLAPVILKQQLIKHASAALHRPVAIEQVRVNPWAFSVTIRGLSVTDHDGSELAGWDEFYANFQSSSLFRWTWYFDTIRFTHPRGRLLVAADGSLNIADLINTEHGAENAEVNAPSAAKPGTSDSKLETRNAKPSRPPAVALAHFLVERGEFAFLDRSRSAPFETHLGPTSFALHNFTTRPKQSGNYTFEAVTETGERFAWRGALTFDPLGSAGHFEISGFALPKYSPFFRDFLRFGLTSGQLAVAADYEVSLAGEPVARLRNASATLTALKLTAPGAAAPFLEVPEVRVENLAADSALRTASIARILVHGAAVTAERRADGAIDLVEFLTPNLPAAQPKTRNPKHRSPPPSGRWRSTTLRCTSPTAPRRARYPFPSTNSVSPSPAPAPSSTARFRSPPSCAGTRAGRSPSPAKSARSPSPPIFRSKPRASRSARSIPTSRPSSTSSSRAAPRAPRASSRSPSPPMARPICTGPAMPASPISPPSTAPSPSRSSALLISR